MNDDPNKGRRTVVHMAEPRQQQLNHRVPPVRRTTPGWDKRTQRTDATRQRRVQCVGWEIDTSEARGLPELSKIASRALQRCWSNSNVPAAPHAHGGHTRTARRLRRPSTRRFGTALRRLHFNI